MELTKRTKSRRAKVFIAALAIVASVPHLSDAAGFATAGAGIKARSMGGAFIGLANDWSAAAYNPAGLAFLKSSELNVTVGTYTPRLDYIPDVAPKGNDIGFKDGETRYPIHDVWAIPSFAGIAVPGGGKGLVFGGAIYFPQDMNYAWDLYRAPFGYNTDYQFARQNFRTDLDVLDIHPTVAKTLGSNLSVGAGLSITRGDLVFRKILFFDSPLIGVKDDKGLPYDAEPYHKFMGDFRLHANGYSLGANAGVLWHPADNLSFGASVQTPITISLDGNSGLDMAWPTNPTLANPVQEVQVNGDTITPAMFFSGNNTVGVSLPSHFEAPVRMDLKLPGQLGVGVGWTAVPRLTLAFDAVVTFWSAVDQWNIALKNGGIDNQIDSLNNVQVLFGWKNSVRVSGGVEYGARENLLLRGGLYYEGGVAPDSTLGPNFPDIGGKLAVTGGVAYTLNGHLELSAAQEIGFYSKKSISNTVRGVGETVYPGEYKLSRYETLVAMTYRF